MGMSVMDIGKRVDVGDWVNFGEYQTGQVKYFSMNGEWVWVKENGNGKMIKLLVGQVRRIEVEVAA